MHRLTLPLALCAVLLLLAVTPGCGAIRSTVSIVQADKVIRQARDAGAATAAPYPMQVAEDLLMKAREEQGYASYSRSFALAREARAVAQTALDAAPVAVITPEQTGDLEIEPALWDGAAGDDDDSAAGDDDDSAGDDDDSAGDDDDSARSAP